MDDSTDLEFEKFLQEDDSSSADESMKKKKKSSRSSSSSSKKKSSSNSSSTKKKNTSSSSSSKKKKEFSTLSESEEAPPSYTVSQFETSEGDPYAFDLDGSFQFGGKEEMKKKKTKEPPVKKESKPNLSLDERIANILKRTGSSAFDSFTSAKSSKKDEEEKDEDEDQDERKKTTDNDFTSSALQKGKSSTPEPISNKQSTGSIKEEEENEDEDDSHLSISDSLGMQSADFEVGVHAKRHMERSRESRLSMSSVASEKFALNRDALNDSENANTSRYSQRNDSFLEIGASSTRDGYLGGLDRTTEITDIKSLLSPTNTEEEKPYESEFEKMKKFFSLDSSLDSGTREDPISPKAASTVDTPQVVETSTADVGLAKSLKSVGESEQFGYDDDEFEAAEDHHDDDNGLRSLRKSVVDEYKDDEFEEEDQHETAYPSANTETNRLTVLDYANDSFEHEHSREDHNKQTAPSNNASDFLTVSIPAPSIQSFVTDRPVTNDERPMSPPPPPPPTSEPPSPISSPVNQVISQVPTIVPPAISIPSNRSAYQESDRIPSSTQSQFTYSETKETRVASLPVKQEPNEENQRPRMDFNERLQQIQEHVASLRFVNTRVANLKQQQQHQQFLEEREKRLKSQEEEIEKSRAFLEEAEAFNDEMERKALERKKEMLHVRSNTSRESELLLQLQKSQRQILQLQQQVQRLEAQDEEDEQMVMTQSGDMRIISGRKSLDHTRKKTKPKMDSEDKNQHQQKEAQKSEQDPDNEERARDEQNDVADDDDENVTLAQEEYNKLKREIETQDHLIRGYQKENEQLMRQLKQLQKDMRYDVHRENEELKLALKNLREQKNVPSSRNGDIDTSSVPMSQQYKTAVEARLKAEANVLAIREELEEQHRTHRSREQELKLQLDKVKKAKVELELRVEGLNSENLTRDNKEFEKLHQQIQLEKQKHRQELSQLEKKLDWYVENQRMIDAQDEQLRQQKEKIQQLTQQLEENMQQKNPNNRRTSVTSATSGTPGRNANGTFFQRSAADIRRIQELESRLVEMEEAMRKRHPDSLVNLILATKAEDESQKQVERELQQQTKVLEEEIEQLQEKHKRTLQSFRQKHEKLVHQHQKRIQDLEKQQQITIESGYIPSVATTRSGKAKQQQQQQMIRKVHELEKELERVRKFYTNKVQEVERKWEAKYRSIRVTGAGGNIIQEKETSHQLTALQRELREKDKELERQQILLNAKELDDVKTQEDAEDDVEKKYEATSHRRLVQYVKDLEEQLKLSEETRAQLVQTINNLEIRNNLLKKQEASSEPLRHQHSSPASSPVRFSPPKRTQPLSIREIEADPTGAIDELKSRYEAELSNTRDQLAQAEQEAKQLYEARLQDQAQTIAQGKELQLLHDRLNQAEKERNMLQELASRVPLLESELLRAKQDADVPKTPSMLQYRSLELKIDTLTQKHQMREQELKLLLAQATQSNQLEQLKLKRMYEDMIAVKNQEIKQFQRQLDEILEELERLRGSPP